MNEIKAVRRRAMEAETAAKEKQRQLASCERYLMVHGYEITRPDGNHVPLDIKILEQRVRCGTAHHPWAFALLRQWGMSEEGAEELIKVWSWAAPKQAIGGSDVADKV